MTNMRYGQRFNKEWSSKYFFRCVLQSDLNLRIDISCLGMEEIADDQIAAATTTALAGGAGGGGATTGAGGGSKLNNNKNVNNSLLSANVNVSASFLFPLHSFMICVLLHCYLQLHANTYDANVQMKMFKCSNVQMFKCSNVQMFKC